MADSGPRTVLVTGAGGRTGNSALFFACLLLFCLCSTVEEIVGQFKAELVVGFRFFLPGMEFYLRVSGTGCSMSSLLRV